MTIYGLSAGDYTAHANIPYTPLSSVYLHGTFEHENKFDLVGCDNELQKYLTEHDVARIKVTVVLFDGQVRRGRLYWWHDANGFQHGLVCDPTDQAACLYAAHHFNNRAPHIGYVPNVGS